MSTKADAFVDIFLFFIELNLILKRIKLSSIKNRTI